MLGHGDYTRSYEGASPSGVYPRFFMESVQDPVASANEGRPIFKQEERVEIVMPGNQWMAPVHRVNDDHRNRWPDVYRAFRDGVEIVPDGTPLEEWPILNTAQVAELKYLKFRTVEHIRDAPDSVLQRIGPGGMGLRAKAAAWLDEAAGLALQETLSAENEKLRAELASLQRQLGEQGEVLRQIHAEMMVKKNEPHLYETTAPASVDPIALAPQAQEVAASSLAGFTAAPRRGRPPKAQAAA